MKNKLYNNLIPLSAFLLALVGCDDKLNLDNPNQSSFDEVTTAVIGIYDSYQKVPANEYLVTELRSDNMGSDSGDGDLGRAETFNVTSDYGEASTYWANNYSTILNANIVIENTDILTENNRLIFSAEAYFMRALAHFNLVRAYENVPFIDRTLIDQKDLLNFPQLAPQVVYDKIIADFLTAIDFFNESGVDNPAYRANLGAAYGLLAKVYMSQPTPNYAAARSILDDLASVGNVFEYALQADFSSVFAESNELNSEILFAISYESGSSEVTASINANDQVQGDAQNFSYQMSESGRAGGMILTADLMEEYLTPLASEPVRGGDPEGISAVYRYVDEDEDYFDNKYFPNDGSAVIEAEGIDFIVLRYADILLLHVEAIMAGAASTDDADAIASYNLVRGRAGVSTIPIDGTGIISREALLRERRVELVFENHRLYDLIRFGVEQYAIPILTNYSNDNGYSFERSDLILPIPQREIDVTNGFYNQNPGY